MSDGMDSLMVVLSAIPARSILHNHHSWAGIWKLKLFESLISARLKANSILLVSNFTSGGPKFKNLAQAHPSRGKLPASGRVHPRLSNIGSFKVRSETQTIKLRLTWDKMNTESWSIESGLDWTKIQKLKSFESSLISVGLEPNLILFVSNLTSGNPKFDCLRCD